MLNTSTPATQRVLFAGLDCLPGQRDLFPTDGQPEAAEAAATVAEAEPPLGTWDDPSVPSTYRGLVERLDRERA